MSRDISNLSFKHSVQRVIVFTSQIIENKLKMLKEQVLQGDENDNGMTKPASMPKKPIKVAAKEPVEYLFKVLVIGDSGSGKTSLVRRYTQNTFTNYYKATLGVDFFLKTIEWDENTIVRLQFWDIAGQDRFSSMTRVFFREAVACIITYEVELPSSFESSESWKEDLDAKVRLPNGDRIPTVLLGNKKDRDVTCEPFVKDADAFCTSRGYVGWFEVSAKDDINVMESMRCLVTHILEKNAELGLGLESLRDPVVQLKRGEEVPDKNPCFCF